jgi:hypothetical protein
MHRACLSWQRAAAGRLRWRASTVGRNHSRVMQIGFRALNAHLARVRAA